MPTGFEMYPIIDVSPHPPVQRASKEGDGALHPVSSQDETLQTSSGSRGVSTMGTSAFSYDGGGKNDDEDEYDLNFTESGDEEEDPEIALMREEVRQTENGGNVSGDSFFFLRRPLPQNCVSPQRILTAAAKSSL